MFAREEAPPPVLVAVPDAAAAGAAVVEVELAATTVDDDAARVLEGRSRFPVVPELEEGIFAARHRVRCVDGALPECC